MDNDNHNELMSTTDATVWAAALRRVLCSPDSDGFSKDEIEDLLVGWFANAFGAAEQNQTGAQAISRAISLANFYRIVHGDDEGTRELSVAITELETAQMWYTRGLSKIQGKFDPADLERSDG